MATTFLEPGGDADFLVGTPNGFWLPATYPPTIATDFVHGGHIKSIKFIHAAGAQTVTTNTTVLNDSGTRISLYIYLNALPGATSIIVNPGNIGNVWSINLTSAGVIILRGNGSNQIGLNGPTLSTGQWYRISLAYTITSTTINRFELFVDGASAVSGTNATLGNTGATSLRLGNVNNNATLDFRTSDHYVDNSNSLIDTGNIWVTAKRPVSNGTTNGFTAQIGAGGSGYGSGHSPQVNERPLSTTNGWSMVGAGSAVTEEYNIEAKNVGDIDISSATIIDWLGWASMKSLVGETVQIILDGANNSQAITSTTTLYTEIKGSSTYPSGSGADIGIITDTSLTTVSLYECGIMVAYISAYIPVDAPSVSDTTAITDSVTMSGSQLPVNLNVSDTTAVTDTNTTGTILQGVSPSDTSTVTDTNTVMTVLQGINPSDTSTITDSTSEVEPTPTVNVSNTTAVTDTVVVMEVQYIPSVSDTTNITDSVSISVSSPLISVSDTTSVTDTVAFPNPAVSISDTTTISDLVSITISSPLITVSDTTTVTDTNSLDVAKVFSVSDTTAITDSVTLFLPFQAISVSDTTIITDSVKMALFSPIKPIIEVVDIIKPKIDSSINKIKVLTIDSLQPKIDSQINNIKVVIVNSIKPKLK